MEACLCLPCLAKRDQEVLKSLRLHQNTVKSLSSLGKNQINSWLNRSFETCNDSLSVLQKRLGHTNNVIITHKKLIQQGRNY